MRLKGLQHPQFQNMDEVREYLNSDDEMVTLVTVDKKSWLRSIAVNRSEDLRDALLVACIVFLLLIPGIQNTLRNVLPNNSAAVLMTVNALVVAAAFLASR